MINAYAHTCIVHTFPNVAMPRSAACPCRPASRGRRRVRHSTVHRLRFPFPLPLLLPLPPSSHLSKVLSISHHSVHTADVAADSDNCEVRTLVKEKRPQAGRPDRQQSQCLRSKCATRDCTYGQKSDVELGPQMSCVALTDADRALHPERQTLRDRRGGRLYTPQKKPR